MIEDKCFYGTGNLLRIIMSGILISYAALVVKGMLKNNNQHKLSNIYEYKKEKIEIDSRHMDAIWHNLEELKTEVKAESNKASLILGYLGTFFFVISNKLSALDTRWVKFVLIFTFLISLALSSYVIFTSKLSQLKTSDLMNQEWDRTIIHDRLSKLYNDLTIVLQRKTLCNTINIIFIFLVSFLFLLLII